LAERAGRVFRARRIVGLSDVDDAARLRLDTVARYLQDVASEDVTDAGWPPDEHVWVVRRTVLDVLEPFRDDRAIELETWCSGVAGSAAGRRTTLRGDRGGRLEAESLWIHLDRNGRPQRLKPDFLDVYGSSAAGRRVATRLVLPDPPAGAPRRGWPLRRTDGDRLGHVNNAVSWAAVEEVAAGRLGGRLHAELEYRQPLDVTEEAAIVVAGDGVWLLANGGVRSAARLDPEGAREPEQLPVR
jgi:acyl-ACP thioesterase